MTRLWPRGTGFYWTLPSAVISTVDLISGSPSLFRVDMWHAASNQEEDDSLVQVILSYGVVEEFIEARQNYFVHISYITNK